MQSREASALELVRIARTVGAGFIRVGDVWVFGHVFWVVAVLDVLEDFGEGVQPLFG